MTPERPPHDLPYWGTKLVAQVDRMEAVQTRDHDLLILGGQHIASHTSDIVRLDKSQDKLAGAVNKLTWALVTFSLTIAGSAIAALIALGGH